MKIALCQLNSTVGDITGNLKKIDDTINNLKYSDAQLYIFPELFLMGYPPRDLLDHHWFIERGEAAIAELCDISKNIPEKAIITGIALPSNLAKGHGLFNSAVVVQNGKVIFIQHKTLLPTYDVFDEHRYFDSSTTHDIFIFNGKKIGLSICEDAWNVPSLWEKQRYDIDPIEILADKGAELLINISASPFYQNKQEYRYEMIKTHVDKYKIPFVFVNSVGANDELIFDGGSMIINENSDYCNEPLFFEESIEVIDLKEVPLSFNPPINTGIKGVHDALVIGIRDYFKKTGFSKAVIGLSGGIDSAVTAALAVEALGADNILGITMPSQYSSEGSVSDSIDLAKQYGIVCEEVAIKDIYDSLETALEPQFKNESTGLAEENLQARIRGVLLMAVSNKFGRLLLTTGNKSEMAVGYCTLYGDMNGGLAVLADVYKTDVYDLARYINRDRELIPVSTIEKAPSAELRPDQKDEDSLPPYPVLDEILRNLIEEDMSSDEVIEKGFDKDLVLWIIRAIKINEYKRRQSAPVLKVNPKAFGVGRRFPIAAKYEW